VAATETLPAIVESIDIKAPIEAVFAAVTDPDQLPQWWGGDQYGVDKMERDLRVGGAWRTFGTGRDGSRFTVSGRYTVVDPPHAVEFTWAHDWHEAGTAPNETVVRYDLSEKAGVTTLRVTHSGFTDATDRDNHARGWIVVLAWVRDFAQR